MTNEANGTFEVNLSPQQNPEEHAAIGRMLIDKQFYGDLEASSKGQMLAYRTAVENSAGYVALEQVAGKLHGRSGTFVLQHSGTINRGDSQLTLTVVPDSGTDELSGLSGEMEIIIEGDQHHYRFEYEVPSVS